MKISIVQHRTAKAVCPTLYCGRAASYSRDWQSNMKLGNPHTIGRCPCGETHSRGEACLAYEQDLLFKDRLPGHVKTIAYIAKRCIDQGYAHIQLACFCAPKPCHCTTIKREILREVQRLTELNLA